MFRAEQLSGVAVEFREHGVACLRGVFADWVDVLRAGVERNLREPGPYFRRYTPEGGSGLFVGDYCNWQRIPEYRDFVENSPAAEVAASLMGARSARIFHEHVLVWAVRQGIMSPPFPGAHQRLSPGDLLDDPEFPVIWKG